MCIIMFRHLVLLFTIFQVLQIATYLNTMERYNKGKVFSMNSGTQLSSCQRRIVNGAVVTSDKSYVVYLVKAKESDRTYDAWMCGGALVTKQFIITSAACVEDVHYMYAIAGYRKYVNDRNLEKDDCTQNMKKKIVYTCVPISYEFDYDNVEKWAYIDIALVKVESPYDFRDARFQLMCSYVPSIIPINYDLKRQASNVDAMMLGWGHAKYWRQKSNHNNYNEEFLHFGSTTLYDKKKCAQEYSDYPDLPKIIDKYMICSLEPGHLNDHGVPYSMNNKERFLSSCITLKQKAKGVKGNLCQGETQPNHPEEDLMKRLRNDGRKHMSLTQTSNVTSFEVNETDSANRTDIVNVTDIANRTDSVSQTDFIYKPGFGNISGFFNRSFSRRNGICQNDHGGPLVTWVGKREVLIGIASVFKITADNKCIGPYLFTSTMCSGAFIGCVIGDRRANFLRAQNESVSTRKALLCDSAPSVKGFDTIESYISWKDHPDGPAENEKGMLRGGPELNQKKDRYTTNEKEDSDEQIANLLNDKHTQQVVFPKFSTKTDTEEEPSDRFSVNIGLLPGMKPPYRQKPRLRKKRPPITRPPSEKEPPLRMSAPLVMEQSPIIRPPSEIEPRPIIRPPTYMEPSSTIKSSSEKEHLPIIRSPVMEPPPNIRRPQEMKPRPILRPPPILRPIMRPRPIIRPPPIIRSPPKVEPPPIIKPLTKMRSTEIDKMEDFKSEEEFMKKLFE